MTVAFDVDILRASLADVTVATLDAVGNEFDKYIVFPSAEARDATVLWTLHAHVFRAFDSTPRLSIRSSEPGSGKSRVLEIVQHLTPKVLSAVTLTPGVMWRAIEKGSPTLILDECDTIFGRGGSSSSHRELRSIINAGHRAGSKVPRCMGSEDIKEFTVFCPVAMAGIGRLPETIATRSVEIVMRKRKAGDPEVKAFRLRFAGDDLKIAFALSEYWSSLAIKPLSRTLPELPVSDRKADVWEPLVAIADLAGEAWGKRARKACIRLTKEADSQPPSVGVKLLGDIRSIFPANVPALRKEEIVRRLTAMDMDDESNWDGFTTDQMARLLREYGVEQRAMRIDGKVTKMYRRETLEHAWDHYLR